MKRKFRFVCAMLAMLLCAQGTVFAADSIDVENGAAVEYNSNAGIQPYGLYLMEGGCSITPGSGCVTVKGYTEAYESSSELYVTLTIYKQLSSGAWQSVWSDTFIGYNTDYAWFSSTKVNVASGTYKLEGKHTVKNNGRTETTYSETASVKVN